MNQQIKDLNIRREAINELNRARTNLLSISRLLKNDYDPDIVSSIKDINEEINIFKKDIELSPTGNKFNIIDENPSMGPIKSAKIRRMDKDTLKSLLKFTEATSILYSDLIDNKELDVSREILKMKKYLIDVRNTYSERDRRVKGVRICK